MYIYFVVILLIQLTHLIAPLPVMSCGMPVPPVNGSIVGQDFSLGARVTYQCNPGFRIAGPVTTTLACQESGRWSPIEAPPRCIREYCFQHSCITHLTFEPGLRLNIKLARFNKIQISSLVRSFISSCDLS